MPTSLLGSIRSARGSETFKSVKSGRGALHPRYAHLVSTSRRICRYISFVDCMWQLPVQIRAVLASCETEVMLGLLLDLAEDFKEVEKSKPRRTTKRSPSVHLVGLQSARRTEPVMLSLPKNWFTLEYFIYIHSQVLHSYIQSHQGHSVFEETR